MITKLSSLCIMFNLFLKKRHYLGIKFYFSINSNILNAFSSFVWHFKTVVSKKFVSYLLNQKYFFSRFTNQFPDATAKPPLPRPNINDKQQPKQNSGRFSRLLSAAAAEWAARVSGLE